MSLTLGSPRAITLNFRRPQGVLFDWDNTLIDSFSLIHDCINHVLNHFNMAPWTLSQAKERIQASGREGLSLVFGDRWEEALLLYREYYTTYQFTRLKTFEGALELFETLKHFHIPCAVVSNKAGKILRDEVRYLGWQDFFTGIYGAGDCALDKPAPDMAFAALQEMKLGPSEKIWFVGDAPVDWECALNAGCFPVPIGFHHEEASRYPCAVKDLRQLTQWLKEDIGAYVNPQNK